MSSWSWGISLGDLVETRCAHSARERLSCRPTILALCGRLWTRTGLGGRNSPGNFEVQASRLISTVLANTLKVSGCKLDLNGSVGTRLCRPVLCQHLGLFQNGLHGVFLLVRWVAIPAQ